MQALRIMGAASHTSERAGTQPSERSTLGPGARRRILQVGLGLFAWVLVLFASAGHLAWMRGWILVALFLLGIAANAAAFLLKNPEGLEERGRKHEGTSTFDKVFAALYVPVWLALPLVAGLDERFGGTGLPWAAAGPGCLLVLIGSALVAWTAATNPYLETTARVQTDRAQRVVTTGPYGLVRHPMYLGALLQAAGSPLVLGSSWAFVPAIAAMLLFIYRSAYEDRMLRDGLSGYAEYAERTRYRLLPGVW